MVRVVVKGGVWKNTEDEILKAAISKYGKNQWARISSLLVRKTPKQCKARWYEWLDPSIKKTEWSREEDEKLLHLAKLMPTQWRTIAPIVGRTATQCLERYQRLLDEAESRDIEDGVASSSKLGLSGPEGGESAPTAEDVRRLRPGEIDPDPETKPAKPDAIDMDEDEKEMLSEARARLANTQGKKAKRKARERALEEARRLAVLQKRRELKAAGITTRLKGPKKGMDYMTDIPFEKQPAIGFYDTSEEASRAVRAPVGRSIGQLDNPNKARKENEERKRKQMELEKKKENAEGKGVVDSRKIDELRKIHEQEQLAKRRRLDLPVALVGQRELDDIVKMGLASESARTLVDGQGSSEGLLGDYGKAPLMDPRSLQTPSTPSKEEMIMREARELRRMQTMQTPLLDGQGEGDGEMDISDNSERTPRMIGRSNSSQSTRDIAKPVDTPSVMSVTTPLRTPLRDNLGLNVGETSSLFSTAPRQARYAASAAKARLQQSLMGLPAPKNDFDIVLDEAQDASPIEERAETDTSMTLDASERERIRARGRAEQEALEHARQSQVIRRGLPRPTSVADGDLLIRNRTTANPQNPQAQASTLIFEEMVRLIKYDSIAFPTADEHIDGSHAALPLLPDDRINSARKLIEAELEKYDMPIAILVKSEVESLEERLRVARREKDLASAARQSGQPSQTSNEEVSLTDHFEYMRALQRRIKQYASDAAKDEKRMGKTLGGYQARSKVLSDSIVRSCQDYQKAALDEHVFLRLQGLEQAAGRDRHDYWQREVQTLTQREREAQSAYRELEKERKLLQMDISQGRDTLTTIRADAEHPNT